MPVGDAPWDEERRRLLEEIRTGRIPVTDVDGWMRDPDVKDNEFLRWIATGGYAATIGFAGEKDGGELCFETTLYLGKDPHRPVVDLHEDLASALKANLENRRMVMSVRRADRTALRAMHDVLGQLHAPRDLSDGVRGAYHDHVRLLQALVSLAGSAQRAQNLIQLVHDECRDRHRFLADASPPDRDQNAGRLMVHDDYRSICDYL